MNKIVLVKLPNGYNGVYLKVDHMIMDSSSLIAFDRDVLEIYSAKMFGREMPKEMMSYIKQLEKDLAYENNSPAMKKDEEFWMNEIKRDEPMYTDFTGTQRLESQRAANNNPKQKSAVVVSKSVEAGISVYHLEKDPSKRLVDFCTENRFVCFSWDFGLFYPSLTTTKRMYPSKVVSHAAEHFWKNVPGVQEFTSSPSAQLLNRRLPSLMP